MSDIELEPPKNDDVSDWANYFVEMRKRILWEEGRDIARDADTMTAWFAHIYFMGVDKK